MASWPVTTESRERTQASRVNPSDLRQPPLRLIGPVVLLRTAAAQAWAGLGGFLLWNELSWGKQWVAGGHGEAECYAQGGLRVGDTVGIGLPNSHPAPAPLLPSPLPGQRLTSCPCPEPLGPIPGPPGTHFLTFGR